MDKQIQQFEYGVSRILDCGFMVEESSDPQLGKIGVGYGMSFLFDVDNNWIQFVLKVSFKNTETNKELANGSVLTKFKVSNLIGFLDEDDKIVFPSNSLETLFGLSFSHLRAIFSKNIAGSMFSDFIVPVVNPTELFATLLNENVAHNKKQMEAEGWITEEAIIKKHSKGERVVIKAEKTLTNKK